MSDIADVNTAHQPYQCEYCDTPYTSPAALIACEERCANERGRE